MSPVHEARMRILLAIAVIATFAFVGPRVPDGRAGGVAVVSSILLAVVIVCWPRDPRDR